MKTCDTEEPDERNLPVCTSVERLGEQSPNFARKPELASLSVFKLVPFIYNSQFANFNL